MDNEEKNQNIIEEKSFQFACNIVDLWRKMYAKKEYEIGKQILKSGTSIGANVCEATQAQSRPDFFSKMSIALKECYETFYWLRLIKYMDVMNIEFVDLLLLDCRELIAILISIVKHKDQDVAAPAIENG